MDGIGTFGRQGQAGNESDIYQLFCSASIKLLHSHAKVFLKSLFGISKAKGEIRRPMGIELKSIGDSDSSRFDHKQQTAGH